MWFVIHVKPGAEARVVEILSSTPKSDGLDELFCPMAVVVQHERGEADEQVQPLIPGCVFAVAPSKWELRACMRRAEGVEALCDRSPSFDAMEAGEEKFINLLAAPGERTVGLSEVVLDKAGNMRVESGPLLGLEREIRGHSERRRWAYLDARVAGEHVSAQVGLRITRSEARVGSRFASAAAKRSPQRGRDARKGQPGLAGAPCRAHAVDGERNGGHVEGTAEEHLETRWGGGDLLVT